MALFPNETFKASFLAKLKELTIDNMTVQFSGCGDSGAIDSVEFYRKMTTGSHSVVDVKDVTLKWQTETTNYDHETKGWKMSTLEQDYPLTEIGEFIAYAALEQCGLDWYNNDGGQGEFTLAFDEAGEPQISLDIGINYMETSQYNFKLNADEQMEEQ